MCALLEFVAALLEFFVALDERKARSASEWLPDERPACLACGRPIEDVELRWSNGATLHSRCPERASTTLVTAARGVG